MADPSSDKPNLSTHPLVTKLQGDAETPPSLVALIGYFGPSKKADSIRLYSGLDFQSYFEIPKAAIVATTPTDAKDDQSPTLVHVKTGTPVAAVQTSTQPVETYLQGGITGQYLGSAGPAAQAVLQPTPTAVPTNLRCGPTPATVCTQGGCIQPTPTAIPTNQAACAYTPATVCTQGGCIQPTPTAIPTNQVACAQTPATVCTQGGCIQPTPTAIPTNQIACAHTPAIVCTQGGCIQPTPTAIPTNQVFCVHTPATVCTVSGCVQPTPTAIPTHQIYCQNTAATVCTQIHCLHPTPTAVPTNVYCG